ncbi:mycobactin polyketide synthase MbtD [Mycolicibacterium phlei]|uniref:mycobactin polyketide synthase MbtD n=1 Tax=Mycolicibacterium phlei TaxID=1771 RepID=UPI0037CB0BDB
MTRLPDGRVPVVLSAHAEDLLPADAAAILRYTEHAADVPGVSEVAAALLRTRRIRRHRTVIRAADTAELTGALRAVADGDDHRLVARSCETGSPVTAFVFPGQGNQWPSMGLQAYRRCAEYRDQADRCAEAFVAAGHPSPLPYLLADHTGGTWSQTEIQGAQFTHAVALSRIWRSCGIQPAMTIGHSLGEVAAAHVAGAITLSDAVAVVAARARAVDRLSGDYRMAALGLAPADADALLAEVPGWLEISAVNAATSVVVAGERTAITALVATAADRGIFVRELDVDYPGHTSALEPLRDELVAMLPDAEFADSPVRFIASTTGDVVPAGTGFADYWYRNLRRTVRFDRAVGAARTLGATVFVEMSAHPALRFALGELVGDELVVGSGHRDEPLTDSLSANIAAVAAADPAYRWIDHVDVANQPILRGFPNAPMRAVRLWAEPRRLTPVQTVTVAHETWTPTQVSVEPGQRVSVVDLPGPRGPLADRLRAGLTGHPGVQLVDPAKADLVVAVAPMLDHPDAGRSVTEIAALLDAGLLDYLDAGPGCRAVCLVTAGGEHVLDTEPVALPAQAALAAMHRSLGFEHPDRTFRHLDVPTWDPGTALAAAAVDALLTPHTEAAVRENGSAPALFVRTTTETHEPAPAWHSDPAAFDDVVITGGTGAVGLHFARYLAAHGARRIVLLSRRGLDESVRAEIAGTATEVIAPVCDVTDPAAVAETARQHGGAGATLLIHAAGTATFTDRDGLTGAVLTDTAAAKLTGLASMTELWPLRAHARILVCSSVSGVWGGRGHAAYSAANRMLDVMAGQLRAGGRHCAAARYGLWRGDGIAGANEVTRIERSGLIAMAAEAAVDASLRTYPADPLLFSADPDRIRIFLGDRENRSAAQDPAGGDIRARVLAEIATVLSLDAAAIDPTTSLLDLGLDSLLALDLRKRLQQATGRKVALATLLGGVTAGELVTDLADTSRKEKVDNA